MTPALSEFISEPFTKHFPPLLYMATLKISYKLAQFQQSSTKGQASKIFLLCYCFTNMGSSTSQNRHLLSVILCC